MNNKVYMVSQEVLEFELKNMKNDLAEVKEDVKELKNILFDKLDERYPTRREFNAIKWVFGILISLISIITAILEFKW